MTATKPCTKCGQDKPLTSFSVDRTRALGRARQCNQCKHELKKKRIADPNRARCQVDGCGLPETECGLCMAHYHRKIRGKANDLMLSRIGPGTERERLDALVSAFLDIYMSAETDEEFRDAEEAIAFAARRFAYKHDYGNRTSAKKKGTTRARDAA